MDDRAGSPRGLRYEPGRDAAERFPGWLIRHRPLPEGLREVLCPQRRVIVIDAGDSWPAKRCSLAHAIAHLDLGHAEIPGRIFDRDHERHANQMAARRLVTVEQLVDVLCWTQYETEVAEELQVDLETLRTRRDHLHPSELAKIRREVRWLEETA